MSFFNTPHAEYQAKRIKQMLNAVGEHKNIFAREDGRVMWGSNGHLFLFELNELGQLTKIDNVDCVKPRHDNTVTIPE